MAWDYRCSFSPLLLTFLQITFNKQQDEKGAFQCLPDVNPIMCTYPTLFFFFNFTIRVFPFLQLYLVSVQIGMSLLPTSLFNHNGFFPLFYLLNKPILQFQSILLSLVPWVSLALLVVYADSPFHGISFLFTLYIILWILGVTDSFIHMGVLYALAYERVPLAGWFYIDFGN